MKIGLKSVHNRESGRHLYLPVTSLPHIHNLPVGSHYDKQHNWKCKCQSKSINSVYFRRRIYIRFLRMSNEDYRGLNGYCFEPEYNEQEMENARWDSSLKEWLDCGHCCEMRKSEENVCCKHSDLRIPSSIENSKRIKFPWRNYLAGYNNRWCQVKNIHWLDAARCEIEILTCQSVNSDDSPVNFVPQS